MKLKTNKGKITWVKSNINNPNTIVSILPLKKYLCFRYKIGIKKRLQEKFLALEKQKKIDYSILVSKKDSSTEIDLPFRRCHFDEELVRLQRNSQNINDYDSNLKDEKEIVAEKNDELDNVKPINWKLQKLEKDFLLKYIETALQKYNKHSCKHSWLPARHKNYFATKFLNYQSDKTTNEAHQTTQDGLTTWLKSRVKTSIQTTTFKHKYTQTSDADTDPQESKDDFQNWVRNSFMMVKAMDSAIKSGDLKPLLELDANEMDKFQTLINNLYGNNKMFDLVENLESFNMEENRSLHIESSDVKQEQLTNDFVMEIEKRKGKPKKKQETNRSIALESSVVKPEQSTNDVVMEIEKRKGKPNKKRETNRSIPLESSDVKPEQSTNDFVMEIEKEKGNSNKKRETNRNLPLESSVVKPEQSTNDFVMEIEKEKGEPNEKWETSPNLPLDSTDVKPEQSTNDFVMEIEKEKGEPNEKWETSPNLPLDSSDVKPEQSTNDFVMEIEKGNDKPNKKLVKGKPTKQKENKKTKEPSKMKSSPQSETVVPTITELLTTEKAYEKLDKIRNASQRMSENYVATELIFKPPSVENVFEEFVVYKSTFQAENIKAKDSDSLNDENIGAVDFLFELDGKKCSDNLDMDQNLEINSQDKGNFLLINNYLKNCNDKIKKVFLDKPQLLLILISITQAFQRKFYKTIFLDDAVVLFSTSLSSLQADDRLARISLLDQVYAEILLECKDLCQYIDLTTDPDSDEFNELFNNLKELLNEISTVFDPMVLDIIEDAALLKEFILLIQYFTIDVEDTMLIKYFQSLEDIKEESLSIIKNFEDPNETLINETLEDFDLSANMLAVLKIWSENKTQIDLFSIDEILNDPDIVIEWINELSQLFSNDNDINKVYDHFSMSAKNSKIRKLRPIFADTEQLKKFLNFVNVSLTMCQRIGEIVQLYKKLSSGKPVIRLQNEDQPRTIRVLLTDPDLIRQFISFVNFLNDDDKASIKNALILRQDQLPKDYSEKMQSLIKTKLYKLSNCLSRMENPCKLDTDPQLGGINKIIVIKLSKILTKKTLNPILKEIFNDSKLLSIAISAVRQSITKEAGRTSDSPYGSIIVLTTTYVERTTDDSTEIFSTETVSDFPERSQAKGKNQRYSDSEAEDVIVKGGAPDENTTYSVTSLVNIVSKEKFELKPPINEDLNHLLKEIKHLSNATLTNIPSDILKIASDEHLINITELSSHLKEISILGQPIIMNKNDDNRKLFNIDDPNRFSAKHPSLNGSDKIVSYRSNSINLLKLQSIDETEFNLGIFETDDEDENKTDNCREFPIDDESNSKDWQSTDTIDKMDSTHLLSKSSDAEKISFHSQINELVLKLDDTLASVDLKCGKINDIEEGLPIFSSSQLCDTNLTLTMNREVCIKDLKERRDNSTNDAVVAEIEYGKVSQATSRDFNFSLDNNEKVLTVNEEEGLQQSPGDLNKEIGANYVNSQFHKLAFKLDETISAIDLKCKEIKDLEFNMPLVLHLSSCDINIPAAAVEVVQFIDVEKGPNVNFKNQIRVLASKLDEVVGLMEIISREMHKIGTGETVTLKNVPNHESPIIRYREEYKDKKPSSRTSSEYNHIFSTDKDRKEDGCISPSKTLISQVDIAQESSIIPDNRDGFGLIKMSSSASCLKFEESVLNLKVETDVSDLESSRSSCVTFEEDKNILKEKVDVTVKRSSDSCIVFGEIKEDEPMENWMIDRYNSGSCIKFEEMDKSGTKSCDRFEEMEMCEPIESIKMDRLSSESCIGFGEIKTQLDSKQSDKSSSDGCIMFEEIGVGESMEIIKREIISSESCIMFEELNDSENMNEKKSDNCINYDGIKSAERIEIIKSEKVSSESCIRFDEIDGFLPMETKKSDKNSDGSCILFEEMEADGQIEDIKKDGVSDNNEIGFEETESGEKMKTKRNSQVGSENCVKLEVIIKSVMETKGSHIEQLQSQVSSDHRVNLANQTTIINSDTCILVNEINTEAHGIDLTQLDISTSRKYEKNDQNIKTISEIVIKLDGTATGGKIETNIGEIKLGMVDQSTQTDITMMDDVVLVDNRVENEDMNAIVSTDETVRTLGFWVYYLLSLLIGRRSSG